MGLNQDLRNVVRCSFSQVEKLENVDCNRLAKFVISSL